MIIYAPSLNQFQSRDPFPGDTKQPASLNGYSYVHNNPINFNDPSGRDPMWCPEYGPYSMKCAPLIEYGAATGAQWSITEKIMIESSALYIARRLADTYNQYMYDFNLSLYLDDYLIQFFNCGLDEGPLTPREAFLYFYGKAVLFYKTGTVNDPLSYGNYGYTPDGRRGINVYLYPENSVTYMALKEQHKEGTYPADKLAYRILSPIAGFQWATHELGHYFEARVNEVMGTDYARTVLQNDTNITRRGGDNNVRSYGFAGPRWGWQQSDPRTTTALQTVGEELADMFLGWNYNQWAPITDRLDYDLGQARANFMDRHMAGWIALVINRER